MITGTTTMKTTLVTSLTLACILLTGCEGGIPQMQATQETKETQNTTEVPAKSTTKLKSAMPAPWVREKDPTDPNIWYLEESDFAKVEIAWDAVVTQDSKAWADDSATPREGYKISREERTIDGRKVYIVRSFGLTAMGIDEWITIAYLAIDDYTVSIMMYGDVHNHEEDFEALVKSLRFEEK
jgi:hypothetical protein